MEREGEKGEEEMERWQTHSSNGIWSLDLLDAAAARGGSWGSGGAVFVSPSSNLMLYRVEFKMNQAYRGGAVYVSSCDT
jgi:hypothetical protein